MSLNNTEHEQFAMLRAAGRTVRGVAEELSMNIRRAYRINRRKDVKTRVTEIVGDVVKAIGIGKNEIVEELSYMALNAEDKIRLQAIKLLMQHMGMLVDRVEDITDRSHDSWTRMLVVHTDPEQAQKVADDAEYDFLK